MKIVKITNLIKEELEKRNIKQKDLAKAVGITPVAINYFLSGKQNIKLNNLLKILDFLGLEIEIKRKE